MYIFNIYKSDIMHEIKFQHNTIYAKMCIIYIQKRSHNIGILNGKKINMINKVLL